MATSPGPSAPPGVKYNICCVARFTSYEWRSCNRFCRGSRDLLEAAGGVAVGCWLLDGTGPNAINQWVSTMARDQTSGGNHMGRFHLRPPHRTSDHPLRWVSKSGRDSSGETRRFGDWNRNWYWWRRRSALHSLSQLSSASQISCRHLKPILTIELSACQADSAHFSRHSMWHTIYTPGYGRIC